MVLKTGKMRVMFVEYLISVGVVTLCTAISIPLRSTLAPITFAMVYLLGVTLVSIRCRRPAAVLNAVLSVTAFDYFCVPFHNSIFLEDSNYIVTLLAMLVVALVISTLTFRIRMQNAAAMNAELAIQSERTRNSLLSAVSHDLRTPLASIYGSATSLLEAEERMDPYVRHELVESIASEASRLNRVVGNLLDMTRLDAGVELKRDWYPLEEIIGSALTRLETALRDHAVTTNIPADVPLIYVDDVLLQQVFVNLLENAANYTEPGTPIEIAAIQDETRLVVFIRDGGPGIPAGDEERVFEKFYRGNTRGVRGAGLGLAICRAIVERHMGAISACNGPAGGTTITVELPLSGVPPGIPAMSEEPA
jgi:two-component system sensor histidine kinase KdpD